MNATFGQKLDHVDYLIRNGVYAVITENDTVAAIQGSSGYFLPGGGIEEDETNMSALARELKEECAASIKVLSLIGTATDFIFSAVENSYFEKRGTFYCARFLTPTDENLVWIPVIDVWRLFRQAGHAWAVSQHRERISSKENDSSTP